MDEIEESDYLVIITSVLGINLQYPAYRVLYFVREPDEFRFVQEWQRILVERGQVRYYPVADSYMLQHWTIMKTYDELFRVPFPLKSRDLSWVTSNYGDGTQADTIQVLLGHKLRMDFLKRFLERYEIGWHLYGRGLDANAIYRCPCYRGELFDKWDGLENYRYTLAFENSWQKGYFSEKFCDAILAGCMPIYWGCPNLEEFFPEGSFIRLDITAPDAPQQVIDIVHTDYRERNLAALEEAKELILNRYNVWPTLHRILNEVQASGPADKPRRLLRLEAE